MSRPYITERGCVKLDIKRLLNRITPLEAVAKNALVVLIHTGCRASEAASYTAEKAGKGKVKVSWRLRKKRGGKEEWKSITLPLPFLFPAQNCSTRQLERSMKERFGMNPRDYRHWFASDMLCRGYQYEDIREVLGHTESRTSRRYAAWYNALGFRLVERLPKHDSSVKTYWFEKEEKK